MNNLISINYDSERATVSGRELHKFLELGTQYTKWFERMKEYGFVENADFQAISQKRLTAQKNQTSYTDHQLTIEMAKEISMIQRNEKGKQARQYFIAVESKWNSPEQVMARALKIANSTISNLKLVNKQQEQRIGELEPIADYTNIILNNKGLVTITQIAKDYGMSGKRMNMLLHDLGVQYKQSEQWLLYSKYHNMGYTHSKTIDITRKDGTPDVKMNTKWTQKGRLFLYQLLKENSVLPVIERGDKQ